MATKSVNLKGAKEVQQFLQQLPVKIEKNIMRSALRAGAKVIADEAKRNVPVKDGDLRRSIRVSTRYKKGTVYASVKAGDKKAYYWRWVEFGTAAHLISVNDAERPVNLKRSAKLNRAVKMSMKTINKNVLMIGNNFVGPTVSHPGAKAHPFMRPALDAKANEAINAVGRQIKARLNKLGLNAPATLEVDDES